MTKISHISMQTYLEQSETSTPVSPQDSPHFKGGSAEGSQAKCESWVHIYPKI